MSRRNAASPFFVVLVLIGPGFARAQSEATAPGELVWEADAPMAAAATICSFSNPPEMQRQFNADFSGWDGPSEPKNRFLSVTAGDAGQQQTIRVWWDAMPNWPGGHIALVGQKKWMMAPFQVCEHSQQTLPIAPPACLSSLGQPQRWFWAARLTCDPRLAWFGDLAGLANHCTGSGEPCAIDGDCLLGTCGVDGAVHLVDEGIVPSKALPPQTAEYTVQVVADLCDIFSEISYSDPLVITNPIWGDIVRAAGDCPALPPNGIVDILGDAIGAINKFQGLPCAPKKTRINVRPGMPNFGVSFLDVGLIVDAFQGKPYTFAAPATCPEAACGPESGNCFDPAGTGSPGCDDVGCCYAVCKSDPFCCIDTWDATCAQGALSVCSLTCGGSSGSCFTPNGTPGCDDVNCCEAVCSVDPFCCDTDWDEACVDLATTLCR